MEHILVELFSGCVYLINNSTTIQWGIFQSIPDINNTLNYPTSFSNQGFSITVTQNNTITMYNEWTNGVVVQPINKTSFYMRGTQRERGYFQYICIGY